MWNNWFRSSNSYLSKRMLFALGISVLLHIFSVTGFHIGLPNYDVSEDVVEVRLAPPVEKPKNLAQAIKPKIKQQTKAKQLAPVTPPPEPSLADASTTQEKLPTEEAPPEPQAEPLPEMEHVPFEPLENVSATKMKPATYIDTHFTAKIFGANGEANMHYRVNPDGSYHLSLDAELKGFTGLFFGKLKQSSEGVLTENGLKPNVFFQQYGSSDSKIRRATFDWVAGKVKLESGDKSELVDLPEGTQDMLSFMYQFMFSPPLENMQLTLADGKRLKSYDYSFEGEESLPSEMGIINTIHILQESGISEDKTEAWLAVDYNYLPVKIRKTQKGGKVIELLATKINSDMFN